MLQHLACDFRSGVWYGSPNYKGTENGVNDPCYRSIVDLLLRDSSIPTSILLVPLAVGIAIHVLSLDKGPNLDLELQALSVVLVISMEFALLLHVPLSHQHCHSLTPFQITSFFDLHKDLHSRNVESCVPLKLPRQATWSTGASFIFSRLHP